MVFCESQSRAQLLRGFTVTRNSFQKDGITLQQATLVRYVESIFPVVRSIMEARLPDPPAQPAVTKPIPVPDQSQNLNWGDDSLVS